MIDYSFYRLLVTEIIRNYFRVFRNEGIFYEFTFYQVIITSSNNYSLQCEVHRDSFNPITVFRYDANVDDFDSMDDFLVRAYKFVFDALCDRGMNDIWIGTITMVREGVPAFKPENYYQYPLTPDEFKQC